MKDRLSIVLLVVALLVTLCGCNDVVNDIAGNVADAALKDNASLTNSNLSNKIKRTPTDFLSALIIC